MNNNSNSPENLDAFTFAADLNAHIDLVEQRDDHDAHYVAYGRRKAKAMLARVEGRIAEAILHEQACDRLYPYIHASWRW